MIKKYNHRHRFTKGAPSQDMLYINMQCGYKNCKKIKVVKAFEDDNLDAPAF